MKKHIFGGIFFLASQIFAAREFPFHDACQDGDLDEVYALIDSVDVNTRDDSASTALHYAVFGRDLNIVKLLIEKGALVNVQDDFNSTPLHEAVFCGDYKIVKLLVRKGAFLDIKDNFGYTPLHLAIINGHVDIGELLIASGADVNVTDNKGKTHLDHAKLKCEKFIQLLQDAGAKNKSILKQQGEKKYEETVFFHNGVYFNIKHVWGKYPYSS